MFHNLYLIISISGVSVGLFLLFNFSASSWCLSSHVPGDLWLCSGHYSENLFVEITWGLPWYSLHLERISVAFTMSLEALLVWGHLNLNSFKTKLRFSGPSGDVMPDCCPWKSWLTSSLLSVLGYSAFLPLPDQSEGWFT